MKVPARRRRAAYAGHGGGPGRVRPVLARGRVTGLDPTAPSPAWMQRRLRAVGDALDLAGRRRHQLRDARDGPAAARVGPRPAARPPRGAPGAAAGERLTTLDGAVRTLDPDDLVVADDTGPVALAGVMGGASTEIVRATTDIVLEAAHWDPSSIARAVRRHRLPSEAASASSAASIRTSPAAACSAASSCWSSTAGATAVDRATPWSARPGAGRHRPAGRPAAVAGMPTRSGGSSQLLTQVGCAVTVEGERLHRACRRRGVPI